MAVSVKYFTNRILVLAILIIMAVWALLFYAVIMDEVYDNIDDGLKNQKILIIREVYIHPEIIENSKEFGVNQFRITPADGSEGIDNNRFSKEFIYMPYDEEDEPYRVLRTGFYDKGGRPFHLEIRTSTVEEDDFLINLAISLAVLYLVIVVSIMVINHYVLTKAWRPFHQILHNLSAYRFGDVQSFRAVPAKVKEFDELNAHIQIMIRQNEAVFESQKLFIENASHELQTPLTIMINKLDVLLEDDTLTEVQLIKITEAKQSLHRMTVLNKSLLTLSRIENHQYNEIQSVSFHTIIHDLLLEMEPFMGFKNIQLTYDETAPFIYDCNPDLALILLSNLLRNAIKYNKSDGELRIEVEADSIRIANEGYGEALNPSYIFERFYKGQQDQQSTGLGLSIVKSILQTMPRLSIAYRFFDGFHEFEIKKK